MISCVFIVCISFRVGESPAQARKMQQKPKSPTTNRCYTQLWDFVSFFFLKFILCLTFSGSVLDTDTDTECVHCPEKISFVNTLLFFLLEF